MGILVDKICKSLGNSKILDRISLYVPEFSLIALLGPSGSGKSSLLRIIAGLDTCDHGDIWLHGRKMTNVSIQYRKISFVFQHYALFKHMTVYDNISFGLQLRKLSSRKIKNKVNDLLNCLRIADIALQYPSQLSGGQKQRVALARSLATQPDFLLLDEPFSALDGELRRHLRKWLKRYLQDNKVTTIMVTHDQVEAISMADEIIILSQGRLVQQGKPKKLYDQPINYFVGFFLGPLIEIPKLTESKTLKKGSINSQDLASDPIWIEIFADRSIHKYRFFLRPYEFCIGSTEIDFDSTPARIETIIYKKTFIQLNVSVTSFSWNLTIPIGYHAFQDLHLQSFIQKIYIKPRIKVFLRAYSTLTS
jgi:sulfate transport system ATP-binding protein|uniref:Sulfate/thiosulfate import ATP-binding protein CysA n=1 Tax=Calypogeia muelleriana TaxID=56915 RepID=G8EF80_9MARC|nr:sulfate/thiosulfate import ATP-binding protein CysA [Calypogeia muelleriana]